MGVVTLTVENRIQQQLIERSAKEEGAEFYYRKKYEESIRNYEELKQNKEIQIQELTKELIEFKAQAHYWRMQFEQLKTRQIELEAKVEKLVADLKKREQQLFGRKSEKHNCDKNEQEQPEESKNNRGQQKGSKGHGRRDQAELPQVEEEIKLSEDKTYCPCCGLPYKELSVTDDSEIFEINVDAHKRIIKRKKYRRCCNCPENKDPVIVTAPAPSKLLPKSKIGTSIWAYLLLSKYNYKQPLNCALEEMAAAGLSLALGTITDGIKRLTPLFTPVYDAITEKSLESEHWHADETRWKVYEKIEDKNNNNWYLWIFCNKETVVFKMAPTRSSSVLVEHFGENHSGGTLNVDRYSAYKAIAKKGLFILAFCWAHVRRDFLKYCKGYPHAEEWGLSWIKDIANLYHINNLRLQYREKSKTFRQYHSKLGKAVAQMRARMDKEIVDESISPIARNILKSLDNHWTGLTVFVDCPQIPMDNNTAERGLRPSVVGRKNYYGSGAKWSAELAAYLFTIFSTIKLYGINPQTWLLLYLEECARCDGDVPKCIDKFLPWKMTDDEKEAFTKPPNIQLPLNIEGADSS